MLYLDYTALIALACVGYFGFLVGNVIRKRSLVQHLVFAVFYFYVTGVLSITLFPIPIIPDFTDFQARHNVIPFVSIARLIALPFPYILRPLFGNLILLFPLGSFIVLLRRNLQLKHAVLIGVCSSLMIEMLQLSIGLLLKFSYRSFDVDDVLLNTFGCACGYVAMRLFARFNPWVDVVTRTSDIPLKGTVDNAKK